MSFLKREQPAPRKPRPRQPVVTAAPESSIDIEDDGPTHTAVEVERSGAASDLAGVERALADLAALFEQRLLYDAQKERHFNELYKELEQARSELAAEARRPMFLDLIHVMDRIGELQGAADSADAIDSIGDELADVLEKQGVDRLPFNGEHLDGELHQVIGHFDPRPGDPPLRVVRQGYRLGGRVLRHTEVLVARTGDSGVAR